MFYLVKLVDNKKYLQRRFETEQEMLEFIPYIYGYSELVSEQNLTGTDILCDYEHGTYDAYLGKYLPKYRIRNMQLLDNNYHVVDIRKYAKQIVALKKDKVRHDTYWHKFFYKSWFKFGKQGRSHNKKYGRRMHHPPIAVIEQHIRNEFDTDTDESIRVTPRHSKSEWDCWSTGRQNQNNWKSAKVRKQYMWHKKCLDKTDAREYKYFHDDTTDTDDTDKYCA